jgi:hypothetical protein
MIRRTEKLFKRTVYKNKAYDQTQKVKKTTIWLLFLPIYSWEEILTTNL